jgi:hypothetical protein
MAGAFGSEPGPAFSGRVGGGGRGRDRALVLGIAIVVFLVVAVAKPWNWGQAPPPRPTPELAAAATLVPPTAAPTAQPQPAPAGSPTTGPAPTVRPRPPALPAVFDPARIDWGPATSGLQPRPKWGIREMVVDPTANAATSAGIFGLREVWVQLPGTWRAEPADPGTLTVGPLALDSKGAAVAALGVTTPANETDLDLRVWRLAPGTPRPLVVHGIPVGGDPTQRLLLLAEGPSWTGWPSGSYRIDVLLGASVRHVLVDLASTPGSLPEVASSPATLSPQDLAPFALQPGAFVISGGPPASYAYTGIQPYRGSAREADAWLGLGVPQERPIFPSTSQSQSQQYGPASVIGATADEASWLVSANLFRLAPTFVDLGPGLLYESASTAGRPRTVLFRSIDSSGGWPLGEYRIDAVVRTGQRQSNVSWRIELWPQSWGTASPMLYGWRSWYRSPTGTWAIVAPGVKQKVVPSKTLPDPAAPSASCGSGVTVSRAPAYIGVAYPRTQFSVLGVQRFAGAHPALVPARVSTVVPGLVLLAPLTAPSWQSGVYVFALEQAGVHRSVTVCVR